MDIYLNKNYLKFSINRDASTLRIAHIEKDCNELIEIGIVAGSRCLHRITVMISLPSGCLKMDHFSVAV